MVALMARYAKETFLDNGVDAVPQADCKAQTLVVI